MKGDLKMNKVATSQERLAELFDSLNKRDVSIADELGVSKQAISAWRSGDRSPKKSMLEKIAGLYSASIPWLLGYDVPRTPSSESTPASSGLDPWDYREEVRRDPMRGTLFSAARKVRTEDLELAIAFLNKLAGDEDE